MKSGIVIDPTNINIGVGFLKKYYTVFDIDAIRVGFQTSTCYNDTGTNTYTTKDDCNPKADSPDDDSMGAANSVTVTSSLVTFSVALLLVIGIVL